jgi:hypothetical protein
MYIVYFLKVGDFEDEEYFDDNIIQSENHDSYDDNTTDDNKQDENGEEKNIYIEELIDSEQDNQEAEKFEEEQDPVAENNQFVEDDFENYEEGGVDWDNVEIPTENNEEENLGKVEGEDVVEEENQREDEVIDEDNYGEVKEVFENYNGEGEGNIEEGKEDVDWEEQIEFKNDDEKGEDAEYQEEEIEGQDWEENGEYEIENDGIKQEVFEEVKEEKKGGEDASKNVVGDENQKMEKKEFKFGEYDNEPKKNEVNFKHSSRTTTKMHQTLKLIIKKVY